MALLHFAHFNLSLHYSQTLAPQSFAARLNDMGVGLANVIFGAVIVGVYEILITTDMHNVTPITARKNYF